MTRSTTRERCGLVVLPLSALTLSLVLFFTATAAHATTINLVNLDGAGEGYNDTTPRSPEGGNPGTTLGALRVNAFNEAANRWEAILSSSVTILVDSNFDDLVPCGAGGALLGSAGPNTVHRDYVGAPVASTWFTQAQANSHNAMDLSPGTSDLAATFNSDIDNGCLPGITRLVLRIRRRRTLPERSISSRRCCTRWRMDSGSSRSSIWTREPSSADSTTSS